MPSKTPGDKLYDEGWEVLKELLGMITTYPGIHRTAARLMHALSDYGIKYIPDEIRIVVEAERILKDSEEGNNENQITGS